MKYTIYKTTNKINDKIYIGKHQTIDPNDDYLGSGILIQRAIKKYGKENFVKEVLYIFDNEEEMNAKEAELVTLDFIKEDTNYNQCPGGQGGWGYLNDGSIEHRQRSKTGYKNQLIHYNVQCLSQIPSVKVSISNRNKILHKHGILKPPSFKNKFHSEETKKKIGTKNSITQSGSKNSQFRSMWITNGTENKKIKNVDIIPEGWYKGRKIKA